MHNVEPLGHIPPFKRCYPAFDVQEKIPKIWSMKLCALQLILLLTFHVAHSFNFRRKHTTELCLLFFNINDNSILQYIYLFHIKSYTD